jgi:hypothetical protein
MFDKYRAFLSAIVPIIPLWYTVEAVRLSFGIATQIPETEIELQTVINEPKTSAKLPKLHQSLLIP